MKEQKDEEEFVHTTTTLIIMFKFDKKSNHTKMN